MQFIPFVLFRRKDYRYIEETSISFAMQYADIYFLHIYLSKRYRFYLFLFSSSLKKKNCTILTILRAKPLLLLATNKLRDAILELWVSFCKMVYFDWYFLYSLNPSLLSLTTLLMMYIRTYASLLTETAFSSSSKF